MKLTPSPDLSVCPPGRDDSSSLSLSLDAGMPVEDERCQFDLHRGNDSQEKGSMTIGMMLFPLSLDLRRRASCQMGAGIIHPPRLAKMRFRSSSEMTPSPS